MNYQMLWEAICELYTLLEDEVNEEDVYQNFFERHPIIFEILGYDNAKSFEKKSSNTLPYNDKLNYTPEPDFICSRDNEVTILDLKTPFVGNITTSRGNGVRTKFTAKAEEYISQVVEYSDFVRENEKARQIVIDTLGMTSIEAYKRCLVYGCKQDNDTATVTRLLRERTPPVEIVYFDSLLDQLLSVYEKTRPVSAGQNGFHLAFGNLIFPPKQPRSKAYVVSYGNVGEDCLFMYVEQDTRLVFEFRGASGERHKLIAPIEPNERQHVCMEFSNNQEGAYMSLMINQYEHALRFDSSPLEFIFDVNKLTLGSYIGGGQGARFSISEHAVWDITLDARSKLQTYRHFYEQYQGDVTLPWES